MTKTSPKQRQDIRLALDPTTDVLDCHGNSYLIADLLDDIDTAILETTTWKNKSWKLAAELVAMKELLRRAKHLIENCKCHELGAVHEVLAFLQEIEGAIYDGR
jgi:hypothetical protein